MSWKPFRLTTELSIYAMESFRHSGPLADPGGKLLPKKARRKHSTSQPGRATYTNSLQNDNMFEVLIAIKSLNVHQNQGFSRR